MQTAGIIGGLGPETTCSFYLRLIELCRARNDVHYPPIVIYSIPFDYDIEREIIQENRNEERILPYLMEGVARLEQSGADFIVIPCNTVHYFLDELRGRVSTPILSIVAETAEHCRRAGYGRVGLLATGKTVEKGLYQGELEPRGIEVLTPDARGCAEVSNVIFHLLRGDRSDRARASLLEIIDDLGARGAEAIVLGCTDLSILLGADAAPLPLVDTVETAARAAADRILETESQCTSRP